MQNINSERRVLIIDDNPDIHDDYRKILAAQEDGRAGNQAMAAFFDEPSEIDQKPNSLKIEVDSAMQGQRGLAMVKQAMDAGRPYSLAFVDIRMPPGWDGLKTIEEIWKVAPDLQVVICSAYSDSSFQEICDKLGRSDSLLILKKPFDAVEVYQIAVAMTEKWILSHKARLRQEDLEKLVLERTLKLERASLEDPLTKIANRTKFNTMLNAAIKRTRREKKLAGLFLIDVDHFKEINDTHGHPAGDQLLIQIGRRLHNAIRETDTAARLGGDEFGIVQCGVSDIKEFRIVLKRIEGVLSEPFDLESKRIKCSFSIGVAIAPIDSDEPEDLMKHADVALYRSKKSGRGRSFFYEAAMDQELVRTRVVVADLARALEEQQFQLYYQPIYNCSTREMATLEALLRWNHPVEGLRMPDTFLPAAEESGLIRDIGDWVIREATRQAVAWPQVKKVAVNVSPVQFHQRFRIFETVMSALDESGLDAKQLEIEITENVLIRDVDAAAETIAQLRDAGVSVVLDDFGVGHSSLNYLRNLPFDKIKLDRSFVWNSETCDRSRAILNSVASLGKELGIATTAEGIETQSHLDRVVKAGFTEVQGYMFAKPSAIPKFVAASVFPSLSMPVLDQSSNTQV